jgi:type II secretory pathway component GspD/PulD (secretin)
MVIKIGKYRRNRILVVLITSLFILPLTFAAEQFSDQAANPALNNARQKLKTRITYSCVDSPIEKVLVDLADLAKLDIIKSPEVTGNVTIKLTGVPLEEALANILGAYNYTYIATENMIRVISLPETAPLKEQQVTRIYKINYADANQVYAALSDFVTGKAEVGFNRSTNHIIVTDKEEKIKAIDKFIEQVDHPTSQVLVEVRIYDVTTKEGFELSPQWHIGRNAPYTADTIIPPHKVVVTETGPRATLFDETRIDLLEFPLANFPDGYTGDPDWASEAATQYQQNVTVDTGRIETENTYSDLQPIVTNRRRKPFVGGAFDRVTGGTLSFSVLNDAIDLNLALTILHSQIGAKLLANPRILVLDNETARFEIVREFPYRELRQVTREDPMSFTDFKKVGVDLKVTPHITRDGMLRLHIQPEFSVLVGREAVSVLIGADDLGRDIYQSVLGVPVVDARRLETTAIIKDGQTIAIGGLRKREVTKDVSKVPVLGDLPLVGGLFNAESESVNVNELIVFITTTIVSEEPVLSDTEKRLLDDTKFTTPYLEKTRIEKGELEKPQADKTEVQKTEFEKAEDKKPEEEKKDITETLDLLLKKLGPSNK